MNAVWHGIIFLLYYIYSHTGIARKDSALAYLIQFNDAHEPVFVNCADARVWSELIFDFLMDKHKYEGLTSDVGGMTINILGATADVNGRPEVICEHFRRLIYVDLLIFLIE